MVGPKSSLCIFPFAPREGNEGKAPQDKDIQIARIAR